MTRKHGQGFTIVELIVAISILIILTTLVVVRLGSTQAGGRDQERESDITTIATGLESYYENGNAVTSTPKGYYPGILDVRSAAGTTPPFHEFLDGVSQVSFAAPNFTASDSFGADPAYPSASNGTESDGSYTDAQARTLLETTPYLYQPVTRNNTLCASYTDCVKFNIYYLKESTNAVVKIRSKRQ